HQGALHACSCDVLVESATFGEAPVARHEGALVGGPAFARLHRTGAQRKGGWLTGGDLGNGAQGANREDRRQRPEQMSLVRMPRCGRKIARTEPCKRVGPEQLYVVGRL